MAPKRIKYAQRYQEILSALIKNGFGFIIKDLGLFDFKSKLKKTKSDADSTIFSKSMGERVRSLLEELGPSFVKIGQLASTRMDLIPKEILTELEKLQEHVAPFPFSEAKKIIEKELGKPMGQVFAEFHPDPIASASIGQVYFAKLLTGEEVAVKVQRPNIEEKFELDLSILNDLAQLMEEKIHWAKNYHVVDIVNELTQGLRKELDYTNEAWNGEKIARQFENNKDVKIPAIYWDYTTKRILTMEYVKGTGLREFAGQATVHEKKQIAKLFVESMFHQIFINGFFHGDPHPGNIIVLPGKKLALIDFGLVGRLSPRMKNLLAEIVIAIKNRDTDELIDLILQLGNNTDLIGNSDLYADVEDMVEMYLNMPLNQLDITSLINKLMDLSFKYQIMMPADLTILEKTFITMEGILMHLDKDLSIIEMAQPFGKQLLKDKYKPVAVLRESWRKLRELKKLLEHLMETGYDLTKDGKIHIQLDIPDFREFMKKLDRISNQLSFSIILLAFSIMMVGLIIGSSISGSDTFLWRFPVVELGGIVATLMFLWLLISIFRSGRF